MGTARQSSAGSTTRWDNLNNFPGGVLRIKGKLGNLKAKGEKKSEKF